MAGSSIAAPGAAFWVTDLLNAAYYARGSDRNVSDLRLAQAIITTRWSRHPHRRLGAADVIALNRAFGALRLRGRGRLDRDALLAGGAKLLGDWFPDAWGDPERRGWGIAFPSVAERAAFDPGLRLRRSALGALTPPGDDPAALDWETYDPVPLPNAERAVELFTEPSRWNEMACAGGRFTALRPGGLHGQTFEIEVVAEPAPRSPIFTRGYVTCTKLALGDGSDRDAADLDQAVGHLVARYEAGAGENARVLVPPGAEPLLLAVLTTHDGHFLGSAHSQLLVWRDDEGAWIRDVGCWDPMPAHIAASYKAAGRVAQKRFWGPEPADRSMLAQLATVTDR